MPYIEIENIFTDSDMIQLDIIASNDLQVMNQDFYISPNEILEFGNNLQIFPSKKTDIVKLEYGADPKYYCHFLIRAVVLDSVGHSALEIMYNNRLDPPLQAQGNFFMSCKPATINEFGKKIVLWVNDMSVKFNYEWKNV